MSKRPYNLKHPDYPMLKVTDRPDIVAKLEAIGLKRSYRDHWMNLHKNWRVITVWMPSKKVLAYRTVGYRDKYDKATHYFTDIDKLIARIKQDLVSVELGVYDER